MPDFASVGDVSRESADPWIGSTVDGRYTVTSRVARGGMSTVYLAEDHRLGRSVAMKVLFPHMAEDRKVVERFEQEARNSALLSHPHVVQVLDQGQTRETAYLVMEHVPGATLRTLLKRGAMTPRLALTYADAILQGLGAAHRAGLVHRDIKPENVLVSTDGRIKLADFGLARAATHNSGTSTLMGTVAYISPELLSGEGADERADVYAVGILLYEMLTGVQPFTGDSPVRVAFQHVNSTVPAPSQTVPGLAEGLDELVAAATRREVDQRPKDADALRRLLTEVRRGLSESQLDFSGATDSGAAGQKAAADGAHGEAHTDPDATRAYHPGEDFPTRTEAEGWDDDVDAAIEHARSGATLDEEDRQLVAEVPTEAFRHEDTHRGAHEEAYEDTNGDTYEDTWAAETEALDARGADAPDRTMAIPAAAPSADAPREVEETGEFSAVGEVRYDREQDPPTEGLSLPRFRRSADDPERARQRAEVRLAGPSTRRTWVTAALIMIGTALIVLFFWYLGLSTEIIPSLGGASPDSGAVDPPTDQGWASASATR